MVLFIFPVIFIIILGPAVPSLMDLFGNWYEGSRDLSKQ
jgi:hypothetical protein